MGGVGAHQPVAAQRVTRDQAGLVEADHLAMQSRQATRRARRIDPEPAGSGVRPSLPTTVMFELPGSEVPAAFAAVASAPRYMTAIRRRSLDSCQPPSMPDQAPW